MKYLIAIALFLVAQSTAKSQCVNGRCTAPTVVTSGVNYTPSVTYSTPYSITSTPSVTTYRVVYSYPRIVSTPVVSYPVVRTVTPVVVQPATYFCPNGRCPNR